MSYARWGCDNSDVYVYCVGAYGHVGAVFDIHVVNGDSYSSVTRKEAVGALERIRSLGYVVPQHTIDDIKGGR